MASTCADTSPAGETPSTTRTRAASRVSGALLGAQSDARLLRLASEGCDGGFEALVRRHGEPLRRYCRRFVPEACAEEVVQQAFLALWSASRDGREIREVRPWLYRVVHNGALNAIRQARSYPQIEHEAAGGDSPEVVHERSARVRETFAQLAALPVQQREAIVQSALDGRSRAQIATALGVSDGAVGQLIFRARDTLRQAVTAVTPLPLAAWAAGGSSYAPVAARVTELASTGMGGGLADALLRGGATLAVIAAGASVPLVVAGTHAGHHRHLAGSRAAVAVTQRYPEQVSQLPGAPSRAAALEGALGPEQWRRTDSARQGTALGHSTTTVAPVGKSAAEAPEPEASEAAAAPEEASPPPEASGPSEAPAPGTEAPEAVQEPTTAPEAAPPPEEPATAATGSTAP